MGTHRRSTAPRISGSADRFSGPRVAPRKRSSRLLGTLALLGILAPLAARAEQITATNADELWGANNFTNHDGRLLWFRSVNGDNRDVYFYDGTAPVLIQAHDPNVAALGLIADTVFGLGSGASPGEVIGAWRRGADYARVWISGQAPVPVDTVAANLFDDPANPLPTNPEGVAIADGCLFMIMQANAGGVFPNHVFAIDPATGATQTVSGSARVNGVDEVRTSQCQAVWVFDPNDNETIFDLPLELQFYDGATTVTLDSGVLSFSEIAFHQGKVLYVKEVLGVPQVFMIDVGEASPKPQQLSTSLRIKRNPQTDGDHVAWAELDDPGDATVDIVLLGDHVVTSIADRARLAGPFPFWLDSGQLVWSTSNDDLRTLLRNETLIGDVTVNHPRVSNGKIAWYGTADDGGNDDEIFLNLDTTPTPGQPAPPMLVDAELGNGKITLRWDEVLGATSYNVYFAEEPGVASSNYALLLGGSTLQDVRSPLVVDGLDNAKAYYFTVTTVEDGVEGPDSGEATTDGFIVDSTLDEPDADVGDGLCQSAAGGCTLRAAIEQAGVLDRDMTVVLPAGTYSLTRGPDYTLDVTGTLRLVGDGRAVSVISGDPSAKVIETPQAQGAGRLTLRDLTIRDGIQGVHAFYDVVLERVALQDNGSPASNWRGGGAGLLGLNATLSECLVANNTSNSHGGGILFGGWPLPLRARVVRTEVRGNTAGIGGGGFYNISANVHLIDSTVHHNSSRLSQNWPGGGIFNEEMLTVVGSAIYANDSADNGGGIYSPFGTETTVINSTISENHADGQGGGMFAGGSARVWLTNVTFVNNTSLDWGVNFAASFNPDLHFRNSVFHNDQDARNCTFDDAYTTTEGYNIDSGDTCNFGADDWVNTDPLLGALADNGGPTPSHALLAGSPALDAGDPTGCVDAWGDAIAVDQRGAMRPFDGDQNGSARCDIGAVEDLGPCRDDDGDGFQVGSDPSCLVAANVDCDDSDAAVYPGAPQICDGRNNDCSSSTWPGLDGTDEADADGDGLSTCAGDCLDSDATIWSAPGEVRELRFDDDATLSWSPPLEPGASPGALLYDAIRTESAADLSLGVVCLINAEPQQSAADAGLPGVGQVFYYLSRARNACPSGVGSWGKTSNDVERIAAACP